MHLLKHKKCCSWLFFLSICAWLSSFVSCDGAMCAEPPEILNAQPDLQDVTPPFHNGTNITYKCVDGFALHPGSSLYVICVVDNETASWIQDENAPCTQVCGELPDIPNADFDTKGKDPPFYPLTKISIQCKAGYVSGGISQFAECVLTEGNAVWNHPPNPCRPRSCGHPGDIENAQRIGNMFTFPNNVTYKCNRGYKMKGRSIVFCMASGTWSPTPPSCEPIVCPLLPDPQNGRVVLVDRLFGDVATYECSKGFNLEGPKQRTCETDSEWSGNPPLCTRVTCLPPGGFDNGRVVNVKDTYYYGEFVIFKCFHGTTTRTSKCLEDGRWSQNPPTCPAGPTTRGTVAPTKPPTSSPGQVNTEPTTTPGTVAPSTKIPTSSHGHVNATTAEPTTTPGTVASSTKTPTSYGHVNASICEDPGNVSHSKRTTSGFTPGDNVTFICEDGYDLRGKGTLICLGTGKWDLDKLPICMQPVITVLLVGIFMWTTEFVY